MSGTCRRGFRGAVGTGWSYLRSGLEADQRAHHQLVCRGLFGGWQQTRRCRDRWKCAKPGLRPDLHLGGFGRDVDDDERAPDQLDMRCLFLGWNKLAAGIAVGPIYISADPTRSRQIRSPGKSVSRNLATKNDPT